MISNAKCCDCETPFTSTNPKKRPKTGRFCYYFGLFWLYSASFCPIL